jgi:protein-L-isoaspartate(D-aspartate) O-methyltransferase
MTTIGGVMMLPKLLTLIAFLLVAAGCTAEPSPVATPDPLPQVPVEADGPLAEETAVPPTDDFTTQREQLIQEGIIGMGITDEAVIDALRRVPRHHFVPDEHLAQAYNNHPLPIGYGQTISQPFIVALMTEAVGVGPGDRVLEIGAGSGYQAAVLAELVEEVYTVEIIGPLADLSESRMAQLGYDNVAVKHADGYFGWEEHAPFDAIVVTAAPDHVPQPLVQQLKIGGRMVIPVGPVGGYQTLWLVTRVSEEEVRTEDLGGVRFVPLTREEE